MTKHFTPRRRKTIALVANMFGDHYNELCSGLSQYLRKRRDLSLRHIAPNEIDRDWSFDGYAGIIADVFPRSRIERMKKSGLPIVDMSGETEGDPYVIPLDTDIAKAGTIAAERFLQRGFRNFGYFGRDGKRDCDLLGGTFKARVEKAGCKCHMLKIKDGKIPMYVTAKKKMSAAKPCLKWLKSLPQHTAVLCLNDVYAYALLSWCIDTGRAVPQDIAILGTNNEVSHCMCAPVALSSIDMNWRKLGQTAIRLLMHLIDCRVKPKVRRPFLVPPKGIVERESTAVYPVDPPWLADVLSLVDDNIDSPVSASDLAAAAGVSHTTLQAVFRKVFGTTPGKYIMSVKMRAAKQLVDEGRFSVKEIARMTGFGSRSYFSRTFSSHFGHPPGKKR